MEVEDAQREHRAATQEGKVGVEDGPATEGDGVGDGGGEEGGGAKKRRLSPAL